MELSCGLVQCTCLMVNTYILVLDIFYISAYKAIVSFHKEKNIIYTNLYGSNEFLVFKRASIKNILGTML
jgi:hypothetical protein